MTKPPDDMPPFRPSPDMFDNGNSRRREQSRRWVAQMNAMNEANNAALIFMSEPRPEIVLAQSAIVLGEKTSEGTVIEALGIPWFEIYQELMRDPDSIYLLDPRKFEELIAATYDREKYKVTLTPRSGDGGRDVIAVRDDITIRIFDQAKRYAAGHVVTLEQVHAMIGVLNCDSNVSKGYVTTTSTFAPKLEQAKAIKDLIPYRLQLRDRTTLLEWMTNASEKK